MNFCRSPGPLGIGRNPEKCGKLDFFKNCLSRLLFFNPGALLALYSVPGRRDRKGGGHKVRRRCSQSELQMTNSFSCSEECREVFGDKC